MVKKTEPTVKRQVISQRHLPASGRDDGGQRQRRRLEKRLCGGLPRGGQDRHRRTRRETKDNVWASFSGFAPADDPQVAILVILDEPQSAIRFGGTISAPVAQKVLNDALPYLGIEPKYTEEELANLSRTTPKLEGDSLSVAENKLANLDLKSKVVGSGSSVVKQVPEAGQSIPKGGTVVLYTDEDSTSKTAKVPDFKGMTMVQANNAAVGAGLNIQLSGLSNSGGGTEAKAVGQSIMAGTEVSPGTVVTVEFVYEDNIA